MKNLIVLLLVLIINKTTAQELYIYSKPASNPPAKAVILNQNYTCYRNAGTRLNTTVQYGLSKDVMLQAATGFSNMYSNNLQWDGARLYAKYRFLSNDDVHRHFRMSAFTEAGYSNNPRMYDELNIDGDNSGIQAGIIATQLINKFAASVTVAPQVYIDNKKNVIKPAPVSALSYSVSAGYLLLPFKYTSYKQTNVNVYAELLGQQALNSNKYYVDVAPGLQAIFNSQVKVNAGYRFNINTNMQRMANNSLLVELEWLFLGN